MKKIILFPKNTNLGEETPTNEMQTFKLINPLPLGVSMRGGTFNGSAWTFTGSDTGTWVTLTSGYQSFWVESEVMFTSPVNTGNLFVKAGTFGTKISATDKLYIDSINSQSDVAAGYGLSSDKEEGNTTLLPNVRYKIRFEYDHATGLVRMLLNGYEEIRFYRIRNPSNIAMVVGNKLTCFQGVTGFTLFSLTVGNTRPAYRGMRCIARKDALYIDRVDPTFVGKQLRIFVENPYGGISQEINMTVPATALFKPTLNALDYGTSTIYVQCETFDETMLLQAGSDPVMPTNFFKGFYNVRNVDCGLAASKGAMVNVADWVLQRTAASPNTPAARLRLYADACLDAGMGLIAFCNINAGKDTPLLPEFATDPGIHSLCLGDELYGNLNRLIESFHAIRTQTRKPVWGSLNKFNLIPLMAKHTNGILVNIYGVGPNIVTKINELATYAAKWDCPLIIVIASYDNVPNNPADIQAQIRAAEAHANVIGVIVFEWTHRETVNGPGWHLPDNPTQLNAIQAEFIP